MTSSTRVTLFASSHDDQCRQEFDITDRLHQKHQSERLFLFIENVARLGAKKQQALESLFYNLVREGDQHAIELVEYSATGRSRIYFDLHVHQLAEYVQECAPDLRPMLAAHVP